MLLINYQYKRINQWAPSNNKVYLNSWISTYVPERSIKALMSLSLTNSIYTLPNQSLRSLWSSLTGLSMSSKKVWNGIMPMMKNSKTITGLSCKNIMDLPNMKWFIFKTTPMKKRKTNSDYISVFSSITKKYSISSNKFTPNFLIFGKIPNKKSNP